MPEPGVPLLERWGTRGGGVGGIMAPPFTSWQTLSEGLRFPQRHFPHLSNGREPRHCPRGLGLSCRLVRSPGQRGAGPPLLPTAHRPEPLLKDADAVRRLWLLGT